jgi:hypothetical protein
MDSNVLTWRAKEKIVDSVVLVVSVDMVNKILGRQRTLHKDFHSGPEFLGGTPNLLLIVSAIRNHALFQRAAISRVIRIPVDASKAKPPIAHRGLKLLGRGKNSGFGFSGSGSASGSAAHSRHR